MDSQTIADLISLVGLLMAMALYAMLLVMVLRDRSWSRRGVGKGGRLAFWTAVLGLAWNFGAFTLLLPGHPALDPLSRALLAIAFAALGFLPAVFVDAALRPWRSPERRAASAIRASAYGLSFLAAALHVFRVVGGGTAPSALGLRVLALGYGLLVPALLWIAPTGARIRRGLVSAIALLAFGVCALHLSGHLPGSDTWSAALFGHHASLPLVLAILYEDYRFAFADLFLKRALALMLLAGIVLASYVLVVSPFLVPGAGRNEPRAVGLLLALWIATALCYPALLRAVNRFVDAVILGRPDYAELRNDIAGSINDLESVEEILDSVCARLAPALSARFVAWAVEEAGTPGAVVTSVPVPTADPPRLLLCVGELSGGRRLLSDDSALLESVALLVARRLDSLRLNQERYQRDLREQEIGKLATEAELRALRAQLNPHFLFNALNTIGYLMRAAPERGLATLLDLTRLLRAVLRRAGGDFATLGQEMDLVDSYLAIEKARFEDRLQLSIDIPTALRTWPIPPLLVQPLVENAIKHGIARRVAGGAVSVLAREDHGALIIEVIDSGPGASHAEMAAGRRGGLGLVNIEKRLAAYYGDAASLEVATRLGEGTRASLRIPALTSVELGPPHHEPASGSRTDVGERV
jgi:two-component system LytT family sensor kinase